MLPVLAAALLVVQTDTIRLTLTDAFALARDQNTDFERQRLTFDNAKIRMSGAHAQRYFPSVSLDLTSPSYTSRLSRHTSIDDNGDVIEQIGHEQRRSFGASLNVNQPLPTGGTLRISGDVGSDKQPLLDPTERFSSSTSLGISLEQEFFGVNRSIRDYRVAKEDFARSEAEFISGERGIARSVLNSYFALVKARKQSVIDSVTFLRDSLRSASNGDQGSNGGVSEVDSLKFELETAKSKYNRTRSRQQLRQARADLNEVLALPSGTVVIPDSAISVEPFDPDVEAGLESAYANRYDLLLSQMSVDNREAGLRDARRTSPIRLSLDSRVGFDGRGLSDEAMQSLQDALGRQSNSRYVELGVSIPLFDRFNERNAVARAENDLRTAELRLADQQRSIENEVRLAAQRVENAQAQLSLAEQQVEITRRTLELQLERFDDGSISSLEFLIDQANSREAEISLLDAQVEMLQAAEEWRRAIGARSLIAAGAPPE
jgi:outer membrane protein